MPSSHSAGATSLATFIVLPLIRISRFIWLHCDICAQGVRRQAGELAIHLNMDLAEETK
ncbi:divergent PAP2 family protein [Thermaerobacillus caldiproteolyticus]|uniref:Acid phosphatase family membrane protein YuiD n=1 Tax=Thermaerobacillus caldiproteolyticus TaxID=247480 RepID=A0A7V9Z994_9BACL|nr:divergent PAP2 family protein [Anoxybacillus caldiproteolyticus]MBA2876417.1 acid phosphatase family membrane protein YuiD [Anoxybacillus caldiproteolyticus]